MDSESLAQRIVERATPYGVAPSSPAAETLARYLALLGRWNRTINLTALPLDPPSDSAIDRLIVEPLVAAAQVPSSAATLLDIGSGSGSPAIPIKVARPDLELTMVESRHRKSAFLREAVRALSLSGASAITGEFGGDVLSDRRFGVVTVRAVALDGLWDSIGQATEKDGCLLLFAGLSRQVPPIGWSVDQTVPSPGGCIAVLRRM